MAEFEKKNKKTGFGEISLIGNTSKIDIKEIAIRASLTAIAFTIFSILFSKVFGYKQEVIIARNEK